MAKCYALIAEVADSKAEPPSEQCHECRNVAGKFEVGHVCGDVVDKIGVCDGIFSSKFASDVDN